jgi:hypothetical protein
MPKTLPPPTGHFVLYSSVTPDVLAGHYVLLTEQTETPFPVAPEPTHVTVAAPRYVMPTDQILSTFPPANAEGFFSDRLPQIVLKRRTLPWERNPKGEDHPDPMLPWLALIVVADGEAELSPPKPVSECFTPGTQLREANEDKDVEQGVHLTVTETVLKKIFPRQDELNLLVHVRHVDITDTELANGDDDGWLAVVLANRLPVYDIANDKPVRYMACLVNLEGQLPVLPTSADVDVNDFDFARVQDWRVLKAIDSKAGPDSRVTGGIDLGGIILPGPDGQAGVQSTGGFAAPQAGTSRAVAVSLNGAQTMKEIPAAQYWASSAEQVTKAALDPDAKSLVRDLMAADFRLPIELYAGENVYRFPVLAHWSFTSSKEPSFKQLMEKLDVGILGTIPEQAPEAPPVSAGPEVVQTGHLGLDHRTRRGDPVRAWYRGPLVPFPTERDPVASNGSQLAHSADQLRRVVPDGREDLSLAAAFEIGRLLGLSQLSVVSALLRFRAEQFGAGRLRELLSRATQFELPDVLDQNVNLGRFVALRMIGELANNPAEMLGPRRPIADPGRELKVSGDLDAVIASGLGLDLEAVRKMSQQVGILAALKQTTVPVANPKGTIRFDGRTIAGLRGALLDELNRVLEVAEPQIVFGTAPGAVGEPAGAPRKRDALDELIERAAALNESEEEDR